jgi:DNA-dependent metalloprotease WSS1
MSDIWVLSYTHLKEQSQAPRALHLLQRIASLVKPIMRKHGWKLPVLSEFFPQDPSLLGEYDSWRAYDHEIRSF